MGLLGLQRLVVGDRESESVRRRVRIDAHQPAGVGVGQRLEEGGVNRAENDGGGANAKADGDHDGQGHHREPGEGHEA